MKIMLKNINNSNKLYIISDDYKDKKLHFEKSKLK